MSYYEYGNSRNIVVSNTSMGKINPDEGNHPLDFIQFLEKLGEEKISKSMQSGKLIHSYVENPDAFSIADFEKPTSELQLKIVGILYEEGYNSTTYHAYLEEAAKLAGYKNKPTDLTAGQKGYLDYLIDIENGKFAITKIEKAILERQIDALESDYHCHKFFFGEPEENEIHLNEVWINFEIAIKVEVKIPGQPIAEIKTVNLKCKALIDKLIINPDTKSILIGDLKTTQSLINFDKSLVKYRYYRQGAFYSIAVRKLINGKHTHLKNKEGKDIDLDFTFDNPKEWNTYFHFYVVENNGNYLTSEIELSKEWISKGRDEVVNLMNRIGWHVGNNNWIQSMEQFKNGGRIKLLSPNDNPSYRELVDRVKITENYKKYK